MRKLLSITLALVLFMLSSVYAFAEEFTPADSYDTGERAFTGRPVTTVAKEGESGGTVTTDIFQNEEGLDYTDEAVYTYNSYMAEIVNLDWNPHTWETSDDSAILSMLTTSFYEFRINSDKTGYSIVPEMAADYPVDVTAEYVGSYGVEEGETSKAWRIALNQDATWENGEKITADDYMYSMEQQLNPKMLNRRADSYYSGEFSIVNAKNYLYAGGTVYNNIETTVDETEGDVYIDMWGFWGLQGCVDEEGNECPQYVLVTDEVKYRDAAVAEGEDGDWISAKEIYEGYFASGAPYESYGASYCYTASTAESVSFDEVGLVKVDDYTIDIILEAPVSEASFYLPYYLGTPWIVYKPLYEECKTFYDADGKEVETEEEADTITTDYCTSLDKTIGYGPYKMTYFELDKQITFERNEEWYGYRDGKHLGMYQTDRVVRQAVKEHATRLMMFLSGELDVSDLTADDMASYASSDYIQYEPQSYTTKITFNTMYDKLLEHGTNSQILVIDEFRKAIAFALDRDYFATSYTSAGTAGFGMLNSMYVYDPFSGGLYRDSEDAKAALLDIYGLTWGEDGEYATIDEAYEAMTGYDMAKAQELMAEAYDKAVAAGIYDGESEIVIDFRMYQADEIYQKMYNYLNGQLQEATTGTPFEGKVSFSMTVDADYYETMYSGGADVIFTTWGGASMSPFSMIAQCYTDAADGSGNQMEIGFDTEAIMMTINVDGNDVTDSLHNWAEWANNKDPEAIASAIGMFADYDYATKCAFFSNIEECYLSYYATTPLYYRNVASLYSQKINYPVDTYLQLVGFGGYDTITYNYDDDAWAEYIEANELVY